MKHRLNAPSPQPDIPVVPPVTPAAVAGEPTARSSRPSWLTPWRLLRDRELARHVDVLAAHERALQRHSTAVEHAFVATGAALGEQTRLTAALVQQGRKFESFTATDAESNPVRRAIALVERSVRELNELDRLSDALVQRLRLQHEEIARLQQSGGQLERAIAPLRIVDTLFRIEAATLPAETQVAFAALTSEIGELDQQVRETFSRQFEALGVTRDAIAGVVRHLDAQRTEHSQAEGAQRAAIEKSLAGLQAGVTRLRRRDERTAELVREIDAETNAIVVALQYQDITRQKLEHVMTALAALRDRVAAHDASASFITQASRLQAGQLEAIEGDLRTATEQIVEGLRTLIGRLSDVESRHANEYEAGALDAEVGLTTETLDALLGRIQGSIEAAAANGRAAARAVESFGGVAADIGHTIRELTWGIRLIALNAQVQAAQVARCDGLDVLARHTFIVSEETAQLTDGLGEQLTAVNQRLLELVQEARSFAQATQDAHRNFDALAAPTRRDMTAERAAVLDALREFSPLLRRTREHAAGLLRQSDLERLDHSPFHALRAEFELLGQAANRWRLAGTARGPDDGLFQAMEQRYTMESERAVHDAVLRGATPGRSANGSGLALPSDPPLRPSTALASTEPAVAAPTSSPLGDNVELF